MFKSKKIKQLEKTIQDLNNENINLKFKNMGLNQELFDFAKAIMVTLDLSEIEIDNRTIEKVREYDIYVEESYLKFAKKIKLVAPKQIINAEKIRNDYRKKVENG